jgi:cell wall-associated NlpC family hydrolase
MWKKCSNRGRRRFARSKPEQLRATLALPLLFTLLLASACAKYPSSPSPLEGTATGRAISRTALSLVGTPYRPGGNDPQSGFDCSGLVRWAYAAHGISLPRRTIEQKNTGTPVAETDLHAGDIVVFSIKKRVWHTGIYTGGGKFVHSPGRGKQVREEDLKQRYWQERFVTGRRHGTIR